MRKVLPDWLIKEWGGGRGVEQWLIMIDRHLNQPKQLYFDSVSQTLHKDSRELMEKGYVLTVH